MNVEEAVEIIWSAYQQGEFYPEALKGKLSLDDGYRVQLGVLERRAAAGEKQTGWKIGLTSNAVRKHFGAAAPVFGYLLESGLYAAGHAFSWGEMTVPCIESELCFTMGAPLKGPGAGRAQALEAVASVAPANEILERRGDMAADLPLGVADNVMQTGFVMGAELRPYPKELELGRVEAVIETDGQLFKQCVSAEVIDHQLDGIAWLANKLSEFDLALEPGQRIMTGSYYPPTPVEKGQRWESRFSGLGEVSVNFV
jgi:2-keto-4-pentenoate hydratase